MTPEDCADNVLHVVLTSPPERSTQPELEHLAWRVGLPNDRSFFCAWIVLSAYTPGMIRWYEDHEITVVTPLPRPERDLPTTPEQCPTWELFWVQRKAGSPVMAWRPGINPLLNYANHPWALLDDGGRHITWCDDADVTVISEVRPGHSHTDTKETP